MNLIPGYVSEYLENTYELFQNHSWSTEFIPLFFAHHYPKSFYKVSAFVGSVGI